MNLPLTFSAVLAVAYGGLVAAAGGMQIRGNQVPRWSAGLMVVCGIILVVCGPMLLAGKRGFLPVEAAALAGIHALAVANGLHMHGRLNWSHHGIRLCLSIAVIGLALL